MKYQDKISTSRAGRTAKFIGTGAKIGGNYIKHYTKRAFNPELSKDELHADNAEDVYNALSVLKGSALKVAQMLSMDRGVLPRQYAEKFTMAQYSAPPLSGPLVVQTFQKSLGKSPQVLFDRFEMNARNAASIGQVHEAEKDEKKLAVKIQYPGVADSIQSDLRMVKPIALRMFNLTEEDLKKYIAEVEEKLLEETDYELELRRSREMSELCGHLEGLHFPRYYSEYSSSRIITMDWMPGKHLGEFLKGDPSQELRDLIGQRIWEFYDYQIHQLRAVHADPHPGNFLLQENGTVGIIDFGCIKVIPEDFYFDYFALIMPEILDDEERMERMMERIEMLKADDSPERRKAFKEAFMKMTALLARPFVAETFDFGDADYINSIYRLGEEIGKIDEIRDTRDGRGSRHMLYINRTYFGLYSMLHTLGAKVKTGIGPWKEELRKTLA